MRGHRITLIKAQLHQHGHVIMHAPVVQAQRFGKRLRAARQMLARVPQHSEALRRSISARKARLN